MAARGRSSRKHQILLTWKQMLHTDWTCFSRNMRKTVRKTTQQRLNVQLQLLNQDVSCVLPHAGCVIHRHALHQALVGYLLCRVETQDIQRTWDWTKHLKNLEGRARTRSGQRFLWGQTLPSALAHPPWPRPSRQIWRGCCRPSEVENLSATGWWLKYDRDDSRPWKPPLV